MSLLTVTDALTDANNIPALSGRKQLMIRNTGENAVYFGWEPNVSNSGAHQGVPLEPGEFIAFAGRDLDISDSLRLICADGESTTINYTQRG